MASKKKKTVDAAEKKPRLHPTAESGKPTPESAVGASTQKPGRSTSTMSTTVTIPAICVTADRRVAKRPVLDGLLGSQSGSLKRPKTTVVEHKVSSSDSSDSVSIPKPRKVEPTNFRSMVKPVFVRTVKVPEFDPKRDLTEQITSWFACFMKQNADHPVPVCSSWDVKAHYPYPIYPSCFTCGHSMQQLGQLCTDFRKHYFSKQQALLMIRHLYYETETLLLRDCCQRMISTNMDLSDEQVTYANLASNAPLSDRELLRTKHPDQVNNHVLAPPSSVVLASVASDLSPPLSSI